MDDLINRQSAIESLVTPRIYDVYDSYWDGRNTQYKEDIDAIKSLPSAQAEVELRKIGEWDMFDLISSAWYGKQCYFKQDDEMVYSRISGKYMKVDDALREFLGEINDG